MPRKRKAAKGKNNKVSRTTRKRSKKSSRQPVDLSTDADNTVGASAAVATRTTRTPRATSIAARAAIRSQTTSRKSVSDVEDVSEDRQIPNQQPQVPDRDADADYVSDDESALHGPCGIEPCNTDVNSWECLIGKHIAKAFLPALGDIKELYTGTIESYNQGDRQYTVKYGDGVIETHDKKGVLKLREEFEFWYNRVSRNGQRYTRKQVCPMLNQAYSKHTLLVCSLCQASVQTHKTYVRRWKVKTVMMTRSDASSSKCKSMI